MFDDDENEISCKVVLVGNSGVGKTCIINQYITNVFNEEQLTTTGATYSTKKLFIESKNKTISFEIWDTAGQEKFQSLTKGFFRNAQGIMVVYDKTNSETYQNIKYWTQSIKTHLGSDIESIAVIIIGNKIDCKEREIKKEEAEAYSAQLGYKYFETSAKTGENVNSTIKYLVKEVLKLNSNKAKSLTGSNIIITRPKEETNCPC